MGEWLQHASRMVAWGRPGDIWMFVAAPIAIRRLLQWAAKWIERMEPAGAARLTLAWLTAAMPGIAFLALAPEMIHTLNPRGMGSLACMAHCYGLSFLLVAVIGTASWRTWRRSRSAAQLLKIARKPSQRLAELAGELGISAGELPSDNPICAVAGILRPRVLLSRGALRLLSDEGLRAALAHERAHVRRRETLREGIAAFLNGCTLMPVPAALSLYVRSREFAADQEAAREVQPFTLANVLVAFARFQLTSQSVVQLAETANLRDRVSLLLNGPVSSPIKKRAWVAAMTLICSAVVVTLLPAGLHAVQRFFCSSGR